MQVHPPPVTDRVIGKHRDQTNHATEQEQQNLDALLDDNVLTELESSHTGTVLSHFGHPVNPLRPCRFMRNPLGPRNAGSALHFTCQVVNNMMVAKMPLDSPFVARLHRYPVDHTDYTFRLQETVPPDVTLSYEETISFETPDGEDIRIRVTYELDKTLPRDRTERSLLLMEDSPLEFAELLDTLLGTNISFRIEQRIDNPQRYDEDNERAVRLRLLRE